jgi:hypothetical protein
LQRWPSGKAVEYQILTGIDVHRMKRVATILIQQADGTVSSEMR